MTQPDLLSKSELELSCEYCESVLLHLDLEDHQPEVFFHEFTASGVFCSDCWPTRQEELAMELDPDQPPEPADPEETE